MAVGSLALDLATEGSAAPAGLPGLFQEVVVPAVLCEEGLLERATCHGTGTLGAPA